MEYINTPPPTNKSEPPPAPPELKMKDMAKTIVAILITFIIIILFVLLYTPLYLYRLLVSGLSRYIRPEFVSMLPSQSSIMATDSMYSNPECAFVTKFVLKDETSREDLEKRLKKAVDNEKYRGLSYTLESWLGFFFWKKSETFFLENQIKFKTDEVTLEEIKEIHSELAFLPFERNKPLWECIVYTNIKLENIVGDLIKQSVVFFRVHQSMADGSSFFGIFEELKMLPESQAMIKSLIQNKAKMTNKEKAKLVLKVCLMGPYNLIRNWMDFKPNTNNPIMKSSKYSSNSIVDVNLEGARKIAMSTLAPPAALVLSLAAGAVRRVLVKDTEAVSDSEKEENVPQTFPINLQVTIPFDTDRLENNVAYIPIEAPMDKAVPLERLTLFVPMMAKMMSATKPLLTFGLVMLVGKLPSFLIGFFSRRLPLGPVMVNNYPVSNLSRRFLEQEIVSVNVKTGCPSMLGGAVCIINSISYKGDICISTTQRKDLEIGDKIIDEFKLCGAGGNSMISMGMGFLNSMGGMGMAKKALGGGDNGGGLESLLSNLTNMI